MASRTRMLAIGIDAAEGRFVRRLIAEGELPALAALDDQGTWLSVRSPSDIGSGAVWPTFLTGSWPVDHGYYGAWWWNAATMLPEAKGEPDAAPFWQGVSDLDIGVLDVPFAPHAGLERGFEVTDWGPHDYCARRQLVSPSAAKRDLPGRHPLATRAALPESPRDYRRLRRLIDVCRRGAELRGVALAELIARQRAELVIGVFGEVHHCAHELWHTAEPGHALYADLEQPPPDIAQGLLEVHRDIDRQVGRLMAQVGDDVPVAVFGLHGMRPVRGHANLTDSVLRHLGFQEPAQADGRSSARAALATVKGLTPTRAKHVYDRVIPNNWRFRVAAPNMVASIAPERSRAFGIPADQHGWIRVNLRGRERDGSVPEEDFESVLAELDEGLLALRDADGRRVVDRLVRPAPQGAPPHPTLPDLVVHWADVVHERDPRIPGLEGEPLVNHPRYTGQHRTDGFLLGRGLPDGLEDPVDAAQLHRVFADCAV